MIIASTCAMQYAHVMAVYMVTFECLTVGYYILKAGDFGATIATMTE